nr:immunoglobulin light chain junction region [Macaca mulatta]MOV76481.1 immunoglobulin light chain junction region [Macaca mulatta]
CQSYISSPFTF